MAAPIFDPNYVPKDFTRVSTKERVMALKGISNLYKVALLRNVKQSEKRDFALYLLKQSIEIASESLNDEDKVSP